MSEPLEQAMSMDIPCNPSTSSRHYRSVMTVNKEADEDLMLSFPRWCQNELGTRMHGFVVALTPKEKGEGFLDRKSSLSPSPLPALTTQASVCNVGTHVNDIDNIFRAII